MRSIEYAAWVQAFTAILSLSATGAIAYLTCRSVQMKKKRNKSHVVPPSPQRHHWVPCSYLKAFATPETANRENRQIWCFPKEPEATGSAVPFLSSIKNVAVEKFFYAPLDRGVRCFEMEEKLARLESTIAPLWNSLVCGSVDFTHIDIRRMIALFVSTLYLRNPKQRDQLELIQKKMVPLLSAAPKSESGNPLIGVYDANGKVQIVEFFGLNEYRDLDKDGFQQLFVEEIERAAHSVAETLITRRWAILLADVPTFITSDAPVIVHPDRIMSSTTREAISGWSIVVPISPTRALVMDERHEEPDGVCYSLRPGSGPKLNREVIRQAYRFVLSSRSVDEVREEIARIDGGKLLQLR